MRRAEADSNSRATPSRRPFKPKAVEVILRGSFEAIFSSVNSLLGVRARYALPRESNDEFWIPGFLPIVASLAWSSSR